LVYRLWMAPFAEKKFAPILAHNDLGHVRRVLDVGCGPGTNVPYFLASEYLGIDLNPEYIRDAEQRYTSPDTRVRFLARDAATFVAPPEERFDFILVNSFLHHVDDTIASGILANLRTLLTENGHIHILEPILPQSPSLARFVIRRDRGKFPRYVDKWQEMFASFFAPAVFEPYDLGIAGLSLWRMLYFKGKRRS
jgi:SAM-dependent methyltransferase